MMKKVVTQKTLLISHVQRVGETTQLRRARQLLSILDQATIAT